MKSYERQYVIETKFQQILTGGVIGTILSLFLVGIIGSYYPMFFTGPVIGGLVGWYCGTVEEPPCWDVQ
jgi:mannitol-specific phosphotransferase system IIBC component